MHYIKIKFLKKITPTIEHTVSLILLGYRNVLDSIEDVKKIIGTDGSFRHQKCYPNYKLEYWVMEELDKVLQEFVSL